MDVVVLVKNVPDTYAERRLRPAEGTVDRDSADCVIDEIDTRGVEIALQLVENHGGQVTVLTMGPERATESLRKALAMGVDKGVHVVDDALAGSDAVQTSAALAAAASRIGFDLIIAGNEASDGRTAAIPAMLAERLDLPQLTFVRSLAVVDGTLTAERVTEQGSADLTAELPAIVSVTEKIGEPRYPNFKGIMKAKSKPVERVTASDLGLNAAAVGAANAWSSVLEVQARPARSAGQKVIDEGAAGEAVAEYLAAARLI
jgi:electron transfer flavoprotein beta subunit